MMIKTVSHTSVSHTYETEDVIPRTFVAEVEVSDGDANVRKITHEGEVIYQMQPFPNPEDWDRMSRHPKITAWINQDDQSRQAARQRAEEILGEKDWIYTEPFFRLFESLANEG